MKRFYAALMALLMVFSSIAPVFAIQEVKGTPIKKLAYKPNARTIKYAFIFDGPSDKNAF